MRHRAFHTLSLLALFLAGSVQGARLADQPPVQYRVSFPAPAHHYAQVEVTFSGIPTPTLEVAHESIIARPLCRPRVRQERLSTSTRSTARAASCAPARPNRTQWNVTGHDGTVRIVYKVFGNRVDGTYLAVDTIARAREHAGHADVGARPRHAAGARSRSSPPRRRLEGGDAAVSRRRIAWTFTAPNLQYLMDSPTELSNYSLRSFKVRNPDGKRVHDPDGGAS